jgi:hypothetical protein
MSDDTPFSDMFQQKPMAETPPQAAGPTSTPFSDMFKDGAKPLDEKPDQGPAPAWSEIPGQAAKNFIPDAGHVLGNMYQAVRHPIDTAENLGKVGLGYMEKAGKQVGLPSGQGYEQYADAMNKMVMDNYGSVDNFKRTLAEHPAQALMDISAVMTGGGSLGAKLPGIAGKVGEGVAAVGSKIDPLNIVAKPIAGAVQGTSALAKHLVGERTGAGPEALAAAHEAGVTGGEAATAFRENLRGKADMAEPVQDAMNAMHNIVADKNSTYAQGMAQAGLDQPIKASSFRRIAQGIQEAADVSTVKANRGPINMTWNYSEDGLRAKHDLGALVQRFIELPPEFHTVKGLDGLKQAIGLYQKKHGDFGSDAGVVAGHYYSAVLDAIKNQAPRYAEVMENYGEAKGLITQIQKAFSLPANERKLVVDTALRKLQSVTRNNASTNYGYRKTLMEYLQQNGAPNLPYQLSGQALSSKMPRGISKVATEKGVELGTAMIGLFTGNPALMAGALKAAGITYLTSTPRLAGEAAYYAGRVAKPLGAVFNRPNARILNQLGRPYTGENLGPLQGQARGGAIDRALRATKRGQNG